jgi:hypothetical protein
MTCTLIGLRLLPAVSTPDVLGPRPAVIVNDLAFAVVAVHCSSTCPVSGGTTIAPAQELRAGPPGARWRVEDAVGAPLGCVTATAAGQRLLVSRAGACPP